MVCPAPAQLEEEQKKKKRKKRKEKKRNKITKEHDARTSKEGRHEQREGRTISKALKTKSLPCTACFLNVIRNM